MPKISKQICILIILIIFRFHCLLSLYSYYSIIFYYRLLSYFVIILRFIFVDSGTFGVNYAYYFILFFDIFCEFLMNFLWKSPKYQNKIAEAEISIQKEKFEEEINARNRTCIEQQAGSGTYRRLTLRGIFVQSN